MKQVIIMIICILLIVSGGVGEIKYLEKSSVFLSSDVDYIQNAIENNNYQMAEQQIDNTYNSWNDTKSVWEIFINNDEVENIDEAMVELKKNVQFEKKDEALIAIEKIRQNLKNTVEKHKLKIDNIL